MKSTVNHKSIVDLKKLPIPKMYKEYTKYGDCVLLHFSVNGQYASQGKLGAAVLANHAANDVRLNLKSGLQSRYWKNRVVDMRDENCKLNIIFLLSSFVFSLVQATAT